MIIGASGSWHRFKNEGGCDFLNLIKEELWKFRIMSEQRLILVTYRRWLRYASAHDMGLSHSTVTRPLISSCGGVWRTMCASWPVRVEKNYCCCFHQSRHANQRLMRWLRLSRPVLWSLLNNSGLDGRGLSVCWNPDCRCHRLLPKSRRLPFSGFLPLDVSFPAVGDILGSGSCRCVRCRGSQREEILRMEDAGTSEEDDDIDSQDSNTPIDHSHLPRNCSVKIIINVWEEFDWMSVLWQMLLTINNKIRHENTYSCSLFPYQICSYI